MLVFTLSHTFFSKRPLWPFCVFTAFRKVFDFSWSVGKINSSIYLQIWNLLFYFVTCLIQTPINMTTVSEKSARNLTLGQGGNQGGVNPNGGNPANAANGEASAGSPTDGEAHGEDVSESIRVTSSTMETILKTLADMKDMEPGISLNAKMYKFKSFGETTSGVFLGFHKIQKKDKTLECVNWVDQNNDTWLNAGVQLLRLFRENKIEALTPVMITFKAQEGQVNIFDVRTLAKRAA